MKISARNVFKGKIIEVTKGATTAHVLLRQAWRTTSHHFGASWARTDGREITTSTAGAAVWSVASPQRRPARCSLLKFPPGVCVDPRCHANHGFEDAMEVETAHSCTAGEGIERRSGIAALDQAACCFNCCGMPRANRVVVRAASLAGTIACSFSRRATIEEADVLPSRQPSAAARPAVYTSGQNGAEEHTVGSAIAPHYCIPTFAVRREGHRLAGTGRSRMWVGTSDWKPAPGCRIGGVEA
jgi:hypothetical protein